ncbi:uncharacterized protein LOC125761102 [Anopheles funestus]|uniref:uncharacterized protein LOC125761102 n=1 Tax=Anopheles funestus TaxID=62324 RepID=UPI0020C7050C|nr:uncharacterized protein LOC125761102 [Anopheles funestus]
MAEYTRNSVCKDDAIEKTIVHEKISEASLRAEIIALQEKIKAMELRHPNTDGKLAHPEEVKYLIPEFSDGLGINQWLKTIRHNSEIYSWQDRTKLLYASGRLTGAAREWFDGFRNTIKTFDEFAEEIKKAFPDQANEALIHSQLASVSRKPSESYNSYVYRVNALGKKGRVSEEAIITYAIKGLSRDPIYNCLITRDYSDIYELIDFIKRRETHFLIRKTQDTRNPSSYSANASKTNTGKEMATERNGQRCYNCSDFGHHASQCTKPRRTPGSCFKCGSTTHIIRNCPEITKHSPTVAAVQDNEEVGDFEKDGNIVKLDPFQEF